MEYRHLGKTGLRVSELCLGTMTFGWTAPREAASAVLDAFREAGGNFVDTADAYPPGGPAGGVEELVGAWLATQPRDQIVLATKVFARMGAGPNDAGLGRVHIMQAVEASLKRLQTDYIDLYQTHSFDANVPLNETLRAMDDLIHQGKVRYLGCSNHTASQVVEALWTSDAHNLAAYVSVQPRYSLLKRAEFERELMGVCQKQRLGVIPYSPLAGGILSGKYRRDQPIPEASRAARSEWVHAMLNERSYLVLDTLLQLGLARDKSVAQMALGWLLSKSVITSPIVGANSVEQWQEIKGAIGLRLTADELNALDEASKWERGWAEE